MDNFTYEYGDRTDKLEKYEWDSTWIEQTDNTTAKRVYYIGDSISAGLRNHCTSAAGGEYVFDGCATSKALDNSFYYDTISLFGRQLPKTDVVLFNNGLHGWHLEDETDYAAWYEKAVEFLLKEFDKSKLVLMLSTTLADKERNERCKARNRAVRLIAEKYSLPVIDLYSESVDRVSYQFDDGCHFRSEGCKLMAEFVVNEIRRIDG